MAISYANRGLDFETRFQNKCDKLARDGVLFLSKVPTEFKIIRNKGRIVSAFPVSESKFVDFIGVLNNGVGLAIEAKQTLEKTSFPFKNIKPTQFEFFKVWEGFCGKGYYLINWKNHKQLFMVKASDMLSIKEELENGTYGKPRVSIPYDMFNTDDRFIELDYSQMNFEDYLE